MGDLGIFTVKLEVDSSGKTLPNVIRYPITQSMDVTAKDIKAVVSKDPIKSPTGIEYLEDTDTFATIIPAKRFVPVGNYVEGTAAAAKMSDPHILWKVVPGKVDDKVVGPAIGALIGKSETAKAQDAKLPGSDQDSSYKGPRWITSAFKKEIPDGNINSEIDGASPQIVVQGADVDNTKVNWAEQTVSEPDVWWTVETNSINPGGADNLPYWVSFFPKQPSSKDLPAFFAIRINPMGSDQHDGSFDILFQENQPPAIYDWNVPELAAQGTTASTSTFSPLKADLHLMSGRSPNKSGIVWNQENRIGILPIGGKLHICIKEGDRNYVYNRFAPVATTASGASGSEMGNSSPNEFTAQNFKIKLSKVMLVGGSCSAAVNVSAMAFDKGEFGTGQLGAASKEDSSSFSNPYSGSADGRTSSGSENTNINPKERQTDNPRVGVGAAKYNGSAPPNDAPEIGTRYGEVKTVLSDAVSTPNSKQYRVEMVADDGQFGEGENNTTMTAVLPPIFHRIRGVYPDDQDAEEASMQDISEDLMSFSESFSTPDNAIIVHTLNIVLYNEDGVHDNLLDRAVAVRVSGKWSSSEEESTPFFTGVALGGSRTEVAGKETLDITCQDYMYVLESTPMVNSPYYDGMDVFAAISDLASRAGIRAIDNTGGPDGTIRQFLGGGYSFSEPIYRFGSKTNLKENISQIAAQYAMVVWFDGYGVLQVDDLLGGIQFPNDPGSVEAVAEFTKDPDNDDENVIIGEKRKDSRLGSVCTQIFIKSIDASLNTLNEGQFIFGVKKAPDPILPFEKTFMWDNPALGSQSAVANALEMHSQRLFKPATGINIRTIGTLVIRPLSFIRVDNEVYRVDKSTRTFNAEDNSFMADLSGEWRGKQSS